MKVSKKDMIEIMKGFFDFMSVNSNWQDVKSEIGNKEDECKKYVELYKKYGEKFLRDSNIDII